MEMLARLFVLLAVTACSSSPEEPAKAGSEHDSETSKETTTSAVPYGIWEVTTPEFAGEGMLVIRDDGELIGSGASTDTTIQNQGLLEVSATVAASGAVSAGQWKLQENIGGFTGSFGSMTGSGDFTGVAGTWSATKVTHETGVPAKAAQLVGSWHYHSQRAAYPWSAMTIVIDAGTSARMIWTQRDAPARGGTCDALSTFNATYALESNGTVTVATTGYTTVLSNCTNSSDNGTTPSAINVGTFSCKFDIAGDDDILLLSGCSNLLGQPLSVTWGASTAFLVRD